MIIDTHDIVRKLKDAEMSELQAETLADIQIKLIAYQNHQLEQHFQQYNEQFGTKGELQHLEDKIKTRFEHLEAQMDARVQPMEERFNDNLKQLEESFNDDLEQLEERFNNKAEQLNGKIEQQIMQFTIIMGGILVTGIGVVLPFVSYILRLFK